MLGSDVQTASVFGNLDLKYFCITADKKYVSSTTPIEQNAGLSANLQIDNPCDIVKRGQMVFRQMLKQTFLKRDLFYSECHVQTLGNGSVTA